MIENDCARVSGPCDTNPLPHNKLRGGAIFLLAVSWMNLIAKELFLLSAAFVVTNRATAIAGMPERFAIISLLSAGWSLSNARIEHCVQAEQRSNLSVGMEVDLGIPAEEVAQ